jgi:hypothetical protein
MRKGQLIKKVLKAYKGHIQHLQENYKNKPTRDVNRYLVQHHIGCGICNYISSNLPDKYFNAGYRARWVRKYFKTETTDTWESYPTCNSENFQEVIRLLQVRVDFMERELLSGDKLQQRLDSKQYLVK